MEQQVRINKIYVGFALSFSLIFSSFEYFKSSGWKFSYEEQAYLRCLPIELTLTKRQTVKPEDVERGMLVIVKTDAYEKFYRKGATLLKLIAGKPGDEVSLKDGIVKINNEFIATYTQKEDAELKPYFSGKYTLKEGEYWISGSTTVSLDSRYIGPIGLEHVIGKAYAII